MKKFIPPHQQHLLQNPKQKPRNQKKTQKPPKKDDQKNPKQPNKQDDRKAKIAAGKERAKQIFRQKPYSTQEELEECEEELEESSISALHMELKALKKQMKDRERRSKLECLVLVYTHAHSILTSQRIESPLIQM